MKSGPILPNSEIISGADSQRLGFVDMYRQAVYEFLSRDGIRRLGRLMWVLASLRARRQLDFEPSGGLPTDTPPRQLEFWHAASNHVVAIVGQLGAAGEEDRPQLIKGFVAETNSDPWAGLELQLLAVADSMDIRLTRDFLSGPHPRSN